MKKKKKRISKIKYRDPDLSKKEIERESSLRDLTLTGLLKKPKKLLKKGELSR